MRCFFHHFFDNLIWPHALRVAFLRHFGKIFGYVQMNSLDKPLVFPNNLALAGFLIEYFRDESADDKESPDGVALRGLFYEELVISQQA